MRGPECRCRGFTSVGFFDSSVDIQTTRLRPGLHSRARLAKCEPRFGAMADGEAPDANQPVGKEVGFAVDDEVRALA